MKLQVHKINLPRTGKPLTRKKLLYRFIEDKLKLTEHSKRRLISRSNWLRRFDRDALLHRLSLRINDYEYDETTGHVLISYRWRWVVSKDWHIVTYMRREKEEEKSVIVNHKKKHAYTKMSRREVERFWNFSLKVL